MRRKNRQRKPKALNDQIQTIEHTYTHVCNHTRKIEKKKKKKNTRYFLTFKLVKPQT